MFTTSFQHEDYNLSLFFVELWIFILGLGNILHFLFVLLVIFEKFDISNIVKIEGTPFCTKMDKMVLFILVPVSLFIQDSYWDTAFQVQTRLPFSGLSLCYTQLGPKASFSLKGCWVLGLCKLKSHCFAHFQLKATFQGSTTGLPIYSASSAFSLFSRHFCLNHLLESSNFSCSLLLLGTLPICYPAPDPDFDCSGWRTTGVLSKQETLVSLDLT